MPALMVPWHRPCRPAGSQYQLFSQTCAHTWHHWHTPATTTNLGQTVSRHWVVTRLTSPNQQLWEHISGTVLVSAAACCVASVNMDKKPRRKSSSHSPATNLNTTKSPAPALAIKRSDTAPVTLRGWLYKQGSDGLQLWKKRWFVLSEYCLFYYKGSNAWGCQLRTCFIYHLVMFRF